METRAVPATFDRVDRAGRLSVLGDVREVRLCAGLLVIFALERFQNHGKKEGQKNVMPDNDPRQNERCRAPIRVLCDLVGEDFPVLEGQNLRRARPTVTGMQARLGASGGAYAA